MSNPFEITKAVDFSNQELNDFLGRSSRNGARF